MIVTLKLAPGAVVSETELSEALGATVHLKARQAGRGSVVIDYASLDQLQGIVKRLMK